jgi:exodeoxyribonuclease-5
VTLTSEQEIALAAIVEWYTSPGSQVFRLHGYAGTGKTTVLQEVVRRLRARESGIRLHFAAPTGKAAQVMRAKGLAGATTLHTPGLIWEPRASSRTGAPYFHPLDPGEAGLDALDLLIVDEASMVSRTVAGLTTHQPNPGDRWGEGGNPYGDRRGLRVLAVGDPAQLWPVSQGGVDEPSPWARAGEHDARLETIHRSAEGSSVLRAATAVRGPMFNPLVMFTEVGQDRVGLEQLVSFDQVIAFTNATRWYLINVIRSARGRPAGVPVAGDRLVLLRNVAGIGVNGEQFEAESAELKDNTYAIRLAGGLVVNVPACMFLGQDGEKQGLRLSDATPMTFADAITCHKAQGSEWDSVLVVDEGWLANQSSGWHYTALTRARHDVMIVPAAGLPSGWTTNESRAIRNEWWAAVWQSNLPETIKATARAIAESMDEQEDIRVRARDAELGQMVGRALSTIGAHKTRLRKEGFLEGSGPLTVLGLAYGVKPPSTLKQLHSLAVAKMS